MAADDRRAVLEAIAYGDDPRLAPTDRLRALELLGQLGAVPGGMEGYVAGLSDEQLEQELQAIWPEPCWPELVPELLKRRGKVARQYPAAAKALRAEVERLVAERMEAEVERRAQELATHMYRNRAFVAVADNNGAADDTEAAPATPHAPRTQRTGPPKGLTAEDLQRPWGHGTSSTFRPRG